MNKRTLILIVIAFVCVVFYVFKTQVEIIRLRAAMPYLLVDDDISEFSLRSTEGNVVSPTKDNDGKIKMIFIFERPCSPCNKNIDQWNRLSKLDGQLSVKTYGIILGSSEEVERFAKSRLVDFSLFSPFNLEGFIEDFHIRINFPQTILVRNGRVIYIKLGSLVAEDFFTIKKIIIGDKT